MDDRVLPFRRTTRTAKRGKGDVQPAGTVPADDRPVIRLAEGEITRIVDEAEAALIDAERGVYQRSGLIVGIADVKVKTASGGTVSAQRIVERRDNALAEDLTAAARFERYDQRSEKWVPKDTPAKVVATLRERHDRLRLPILAGIINAPTLRDDGSVLERPGFDEPTGLFFDPRGTAFPSMPKRPSQDDARTALARIQSLFGTMPFVSEADRAVAISAVLTALTRNAYATAPMHAVTAPAAGSGKSMIVDAATMVATGRKAGVIAPGKSPEEMEKRLGGALLGADPVLALDNCETGIGGDLLCQMLTQEIVKVRPLGGSTILDLPTNVFITATGNNLVLVGDMTRRVVLCRIDAHVERPELRVFEGPDPVAQAQTQRGELAVAALTIMRAFALAGRPAQRPVLGSFEGWSRAVRDALLWAGSADPVDTMEEARKGDPSLSQLGDVLAQWDRVIGIEKVSTSQIIARATKKSDFVDGAFVHGEFREALLIVAGQHGNIDTRRLGNWIGGIKDKPVNGRCITKWSETGGSGVWQLVRDAGNERSG